jgi:hypothetical protein
MCAPGCLEHVAARLSRRNFLKATAAAATATAASLAGPVSEARSFPEFSCGDVVHQVLDVRVLAALTLALIARRH